MSIEKIAEELKHMDVEDLNTVMRMAADELLKRMYSHRKEALRGHHTLNKMQPSRPTMQDVIRQVLSSRPIHGLSRKKLAIACTEAGFSEEEILQCFYRDALRPMIENGEIVQNEGHNYILKPGR